MLRDSCDCNDVYGRHRSLTLPLPRSHLRRLLDNSEVSRFAETVRRRMPLIVFIASACHIILFAVYTSLVLQSK